MKRILPLLAVMLACLTGYSQTNTPPLLPEPPATNAIPSLPEHVATWLDFLSHTGTNWLVVPYAIYVDDDVNSMGGGLAVMYSLSPYVLTGLRLDYVNEELWMPSINVSLQLPIRLANTITVAPFAISGVATALGNEQDHGEAVGIFGGGLALKVSKKMGLVYDAEMWTGFSGTQHRFGVYWKF